MRACQLLHRKISNHIRRPIKEVNLIFPYLLETHDSKNVEIQDATMKNILVIDNFLMQIL